MALRIGVIGGGQLARMMIPPAVNLGLEISVLAEIDDSSAKLAATMVGDYRDPETVYAFADTVDVITFDHEHVPEQILRELERRGKQVHPGPDALRYAQDKILMREKLTRLGLPVPAWTATSEPGDIDEFIASHGGVAVAKTARGGYDGKGVRVIHSSAEVSDWLAELGGPDAPDRLLIEERVEFRRELSQLVARRPSGQTRAWPLVETVQEGGVCSEVIAPAPVSNPKIAEVAAQIGYAVAEGVSVTGVLAVEMFETVDGRVLVNELAMRPHNSGHFTIEGSITSQFEQHLRAVADLPLGATALTAPVIVMANVLGGPPEGTMDVRYETVMSRFPAAKIHSYAKTPRPGRKVGHVTMLGESLGQVLADARACATEFK